MTLIDSSIRWLMIPAPQITIEKCQSDRQGKLHRKFKENKENMGNQLVTVVPSEILPVEHYLTDHHHLRFDHRYN